MHLRLVEIVSLLNLVFQICYARANVSMDLTLDFTADTECLKNPYKVVVCVGQGSDNCRLFGSHTFFAQSVCNGYGSTEPIGFMVENVVSVMHHLLINYACNQHPTPACSESCVEYCDEEQPLRIDSQIEVLNTNLTTVLPTQTVNITVSDKISTSSSDLKLIVQFRFRYNCAPNYFGKLCSVFCSSETKEHHCSPTGEKICYKDYVKDGDSCIYDVCGSMKNYCKNGGSCVNTMHHGAGKPVPLCICPPNRTGLQCETYREAPTTTTTSTTTTTPRPLGSPIPRRHPEVGTRIEPAEHYPSHQNFAEPDLINNRPMRISGYQPVLEQPTTDRRIWQHVMIITAVAICLAVLAVGVCIGTGCYVARIKAQAELLRHHQEMSLGNMQFLDNGHNNNASHAGDISMYLNRCNSPEFAGPNPIHHHPASMNSFVMNHHSMSSANPTLNPSSQPLLMTSNGYSPTRAEGLVWNTINRTNPKSAWGDYGLATFSHRRASHADDMEISFHGGDTLPKMNPADAYGCLHNNLGPVDICSPSLMPHLMNNNLARTLRSTSSPTRAGHSTPIHQTLDRTKNDLQPEPPAQFADYDVKIGHHR